MRIGFRREAGLPADAYVELVRSLPAGLPPSIIMTILFVAASALAWWATRDPWLAALSSGGVAASILRLAIAIEGARDPRGRIFDLRSAVAYERRFAASYIGFALILGLFGARAMLLPRVDLHMLIAALLVGYAAGAATGLSLRPRICGPSMIVAVVPAALACFTTLEIFHLALGLSLIALLGGALQSVTWRYRTTIEKIVMARKVAGLARRDHLTGLPNRLGLSERYDEVALAHRKAGRIAVHCIDLDRFKPVNDRYGHPTGDALLGLVAVRLSGCLRGGDLAARIGGDEFVVLQCGVQGEDEAKLLGRRLVRALCRPYQISDLTIAIGASLGYVVAEPDLALDDLIARADAALYAIKAAGGGAVGQSAGDRHGTSATA